MSSTVAKTPFPQAIGKRLKQLRAAVQRFTLVDGLSKLLLVVLALVLVDVALDRFFRMDVAQRGIMLCVMGATIVAVLFYRLIRPLSQTVSDDALILQVEGRNQELQQSVISAAQFSRGSDYESQGVSPTMVDATIRHGSKMAESVSFGNVIDSGALARNLFLLVVCLAGLGAIGYGVAQTDFWRTWFNRNVLLTNDQWPRNTVLLITGVEDNALTLLRGEDHKQVVQVDPGSRKSNVDVSIEFEDGHSRTTQKMRRTGELEHTLVFRNVTSEFRFRARGGDDVTDWVQVNLVEAPTWSSISMMVDMPEYTGVAPFELPTGGGPHTVMEGSSLTIRGNANKELTSASLKNGDQQWPMIRDEQGQWNLSIPAADLPGGKYTFDLADESGLRSSRPVTFTIKLKPDRAPSVRATLLGISGLVVPRARIPMSFTAGDEFAITEMSMLHSWSGSSNESVAQSGQIDLTQLNPELAQELGKSEIKSAVVTDLEPLQIPIDVSLKLTMTATDNNSLSGPGIGKSREFLLRVVSEEELRADLLRREIEQRKAFELIMGNQEKLVFDLQAIADAHAGSSPAMTADETLDLLRDAHRRQKLVGTNVSRIADHFQDFLVEAVNNRLDEAESEIEQSQSIEERFNDKIILPIRELDGVQIIRASQLIQSGQRAVVLDASGQKSIEMEALSEAIDESIAEQNRIIETMQEILASMKDSETYQEIVNKVIEIKRTEERIREKARQKREEIGSGDIFDDDQSGGIFDDDSKGSESEDGQKNEDG